MESRNAPFIGLCSPLSTVSSTLINRYMHSLPYSIPSDFTCIFLLPRHWCLNDVHRNSYRYTGRGRPKAPKPHMAHIYICLWKKAFWWASKWLIGCNWVNIGVWPSFTNCLRTEQFVISIYDLSKSFLIGLDRIFARSTVLCRIPFWCRDTNSLFTPPPPAILAN